MIDRMNDRQCLFNLLWSYTNARAGIGGARPKREEIYELEATIAQNLDRVPEMLPSLTFWRAELIARLWLDGGLR